VTLGVACCLRGMTVVQADGEAAMHLHGADGECE
jgi:hypothetical protein